MSYTLDFGRGAARPYRCPSFCVVLDQIVSPLLFGSSCQEFRTSLTPNLVMFGREPLRRVRHFRTSPDMADRQTSARHEDAMRRAAIWPKAIAFFLPIVLYSAIGFLSWS